MVRTCERAKSLGSSSERGQGTPGESGVVLTNVHAFDGTEVSMKVFALQYYISEFLSLFLLHGVRYVYV